MRRYGWLVVFSSLVISPPTATSAPFDNQPKLLLHVGAPTSKGACAAGALTNCGSGITSGGLYTPGSGLAYFVYLLAAPGNVGGITGIECGIHYEDDGENDDLNGDELDVFAWTVCAALDFQSPAPHRWPKPGGGNLITFAGCETNETAVAGYFYVAAYGDDEMLLTPRPVSGQAAVANCASIETALDQDDLGAARFSSGATEPGCNPCNADCQGVPPPPPNPADAMIMLHITSPVTKNVCANGFLSDPEDAVTAAGLSTTSGPYFFTYLLVAREREQNIRGMQCGITYENHQPGDDLNGAGIDIFDWTLCGDLEFVTPGVDMWPKPGGGNLVTWTSAHCQTGATAVAGYFYMAAYSPDVLRVIARPVDGAAKAARCDATEIGIPAERLGFATFSTTASTPGCNPWTASCGGDPTPVENTTWGAIKTLYSR